MHQYQASVTWQRGEQRFLDNRYSRAHQWSFDGGLQVAASSSPLSVPLPMSDAGAVDPEEALIAALSGCHMLFFLSIAAQRGFVVDSYHDQAVGTMQKDASGKQSITHIVLRPAITFSGEKLPDRAARDDMHHSAHTQCYIANSIKADVSIEEG
ncbi:MAG TPA: OsmC family protein [Telluria sp.]